MTEFLVCFNWCNGEQPQPKRRQRLDRNMIGEPMNFVHNAHVGIREMSSDFSSVSAHPWAVSIQDHMKSKGGYTNGTSTTAEL
ncbi:CDC42 small effector protein 2-B-like isoform X1 [Cyrtonyx montezumae]|uniref:CDC42 small effector protein 2-B-like isoform X1 n=1 Tax=Cyrtonyx montezumae TaxID=9017 RepID=UPI0032D9DC95